jgi:hypothetical protein
VSRQHNIGRCIAVFGYAVLSVNAVLNYMWGSSHSEHMHESGQYLGLWPTTVVIALSFAMITLLFTAEASRQKRALTSLAGILIVGIPRIATDPRCLANITTQHGCHTFMAAMLLVLVGAALMLLPVRAKSQ